MITVKYLNKIEFSQQESNLRENYKKVVYLNFFLHLIKTIAIIT
jgi:hypothetical protein